MPWGVNANEPIALHGPPAGAVGVVGFVGEVGVLGVPELPLSPPPPHRAASSTRARSQASRWTRKGGRTGHLSYGGCPLPAHGSWFRLQNRPVTPPVLKCSAVGPCRQGPGGDPGSESGPCRRAVDRRRFGGRGRRVPAGGEGRGPAGRLCGWRGALWYDAPHCGRAPERPACVLRGSARPSVHLRRGAHL